MLDCNGLRKEAFVTVSIFGSAELFQIISGVGFAVNTTIMLVMRNLSGLLEEFCHALIYLAGAYSTAIVGPLVSTDCLCLCLLDVVLFVHVLNSLGESLGSATLCNQPMQCAAPAVHGLEGTFWNFTQSAG